MWIFVYIIILQHCLFLSFLEVSQIKRWSDWFSNCPDLENLWQKCYKLRLRSLGKCSCKNMAAIWNSLNCKWSFAKLHFLHILTLLNILFYNKYYFHSIKNKRKNFICIIAYRQEGQALFFSILEQAQGGLENLRFA